MKNMLRALLISLLLLFFFTKSYSQATILISTGGTVTANNGDLFYDAGGAAGNDGNTNRTITLAPPAGQSLCVDFSMFNTYYDVSSLSWGYGDSLCIFDGSSTAATKIATLTGNYGTKWNNGTTPTPVGIGTGSGLPAVTTPGIFCATNAAGTLTFAFYNVDATQSPGWAATIVTYTALGTPGCNIDITASPNPICPGTPVTLTATGTIVAAAINNNFNASTVGTGWQGTSSATFQTNVCSKPSLDASVYLWMSSAACPRTLTSNGMDVSTGGTVSFEYRQADGNSDPSPCEAPDINMSGSTPEAVFIQYSTNAGTTWNTMKVMFPYDVQCPSGTCDDYPGTGYEAKTWHKIVVPIPAAAKTTNTQFRWIMPLCTSASTDNWGLDNVVISSPKTSTLTIRNLTTGGTLVATSATSPLTTSVSPLVTTTYRATISDGVDSCFKDVTVTVNPGGTPTTGFSYTTPICANAANPSPTTVAGFTTGGTYSSTAGLSINASTGAINLAASTAGTYVVTYSVTASGCTSAGSSTSSITITNSGTPTTGFSYTTPICANAANPSPTTVAGFTTGGTYSSTVGLSINASTGAINLAASTAGTYTITYSVTASGCITAGSSTSSITITNSGTPTTSFSYTTPICANAANPSPSTAAGFTTGGTYSSTAGLSINASTGVINLAASTAGTYVVTYSVTASGCITAGSSTSSITITNGGAPTTGFSYSTPICANAANPSPTTVAGFTTGGTYSSTGGLTINASTGVIDLTTSVPGTYTITYAVAATGCSSAANSTSSITINPVVTPVTGFNYTSPVCLNAVNPNPTTVTGFTTGGNFSSSAGITVNASTGVIDLSTSSIGTYTIHYNVAAAGCSPAAIDSSVITLITTPSGTSVITGNSPVCQNATNINYSVTTIVGSTFTWAVPSGAAIVSGQGTNAVVVNWGTAAGIISVTESNSCGAATPINLNVNLTNVIPTSAITGPSTTCPNTNALNYSVTNANIGSTYNWTVTGGTIASGNGTSAITVNWGTSGAGTVSVTETTSCGSLTPVSSTVSINSPPPPPTITTSNDTICNNNTGVVYSVTNNPTSNYAWVVPVGATIISGQNTNSISVNWGVTGGTVSVTEISTCGNGALSSINVTLLSTPPAPSVTGQDTLCANSLQNIYSTTPTAGTTLNWTVSGGTITSGTGTSNIHVNWGSGPSGVVSLTESNVCGISPATIFSVDLIQVVITPSEDQNICKGQSVQLSVSGNANNYIWSPSAGLDNSSSANPVASPTITTQYIVTSLGKCLKSDTVVVNVINVIKPSFDIAAENFYLGTPLTFVNTNNQPSITYFWDLGDETNSTLPTNIEHTYGDTGVYVITLTGTNALNCKDTAMRTITISEIPALYIPNAFTPNHDHNNELFKAYFAAYKKIDASIFDR